MMQQAPSARPYIAALAYTDPRRFGRIRLVAGDVTLSPPISDLGFDPLLAMPDDATFAAAFSKRAAAIKVGQCMLTQ
jgi:formamidopyrimidine-DNA glycosylase